MLLRAAIRHWSASIKRAAYIAYAIWLLGTAGWFFHRCSGSGQWAARAYADLGVQVVDYTVPFDNYREHSGLFWLLNHRKIRPPHLLEKPGVDPEEGEPWDLARDYVGYRPTDREHPVRISHVDRKRSQLIYVTDTYGVYKGDLENIDSRVAHMDYTSLVFGGLSDGDVHALSDFAAKGGVLLAEFNTFCDPTDDSARRHMESVFGVQWTEWVGRVFADPYDTSDVPHWLPREFARQYPDRELPHSPILLLIGRDGTLEVLPGPSLIDVAPRVVMTPEGTHRYPNAPGDAPYYFWFGVVSAQPDTVVQARLKLPNLAGMPELLARIGVRPDPPALTEHVYQKGKALYLVGDFADLDFDPGAYDNDDAIAEGAKKVSALTGLSTAPSFWRFYAPVLDQLLREGVDHAAQRAPAR